MDRVSEPAPRRRPKRTQSIDHATTRPKAIPEALERDRGATVVDRRRLDKALQVVRRDGHCACVGEVEEALLR
jgi:hypothetical protein